MGKQVAKPRKRPLLPKSFSLQLWPFSRRTHRAGPSSTRAAETYRSAASLSLVDRYLLENFPSLYHGGAFDSDEDIDGFADEIRRSCCISEPTDVSPPSAVRSTPRFFVQPTAARSLAEEARVSAASGSSGSDRLYDSSPSAAPSTAPSGEAKVAFSDEPYGDFLRSMREMVEAHHAAAEGRLDWDFMEELLFSYLDLNDRSMHSHILRAFTDIAASFRGGAR